MAAPDEVGVRRPIDGSFRVTSDTAEHALRGVGPATDYAGVDGALPIGTPVVAPFDVSGFRRWGDPKLDPGGRALNSTSPDGRFTFVAQHLSAYKDVSGLVPAGGVIAFSGNSGAFTTGPHLHCYVVADGIRMSMEEAIGKFGLMGDGASAGLLSFATQLPEDDMFTEEDRATLALLAARTASPTIPLLVQTADKADERLFLLMDSGQIRQIGPTEKSVYVKRAEQLGYAAEDFDRLFTSRIGGLGNFPGFTEP